MSAVKDFILECDVFAHGTFHRYKEEESYRTLIGGVISVILVVFFSITFANLTINTFRKDIVISSQSISYD